MWRKSLLLILLTIWSVDAVSNKDFYFFPEGVHLENGETFDYIVVGAGAAGAAASARLALAGHRVLLVEAGGDPNVLSKIPGTAMATLATDIIWSYMATPNNKSCFSSIDQQCRVIRGKCLGGSTTVNYMIYTRGNRLRDFEEIRSPGWTFDDLMPYFLKYEGLQDLNQLPRSSIPYHNTTGLMRIGFFDDPLNPWHWRIMKSFNFLDVPINPDVNAESQIGVSKVLGYVYRGERMSTARAYLTRNDVKKVLTVAKHAMCTGVIIDTNNIARGVTVVQNNKSIKLYARKEVILSAGAIGTPQILMLSGIGPSDHLKSMNIPVRVDLPVGNGWTDHVLSLVFVQVDRTINSLKWVVKNINQLKELFADGSGALTSNGLTDIMTFINSNCYDFKRRRLMKYSYDGSDCEVPNLHLINVYVEKYVLLLVGEIFKSVAGFTDNVLNQLYEVNKDRALIFMTPIVLEPRSVGKVRLKSRDPLVKPVIYPNYLEDVRDVDGIVKGIRIIQHLVDTPLFRKSNASIVRLKLPGCPHFEDDSQEYWECYTRHLTSAVFHAAGTAALDRVVDARLRVFGVQRLRVADLSVLPRAPRATTAAVTIAIGERVADFILEEDNWTEYRKYYPTNYHGWK